MTYVGNEKLMKKQSIAYEPCESAGTIVYVGQEQTFLGALVISDTVKEGAAEAIHKMKNVGVKKCVMLTGDREKTAKHVADELKLDEVHAELLPGDKVDEVEKLLSAQKDGERLAFVGDGICPCRKSSCTFAWCNWCGEYVGSCICRCRCICFGNFELNAGDEKSLT